MAGAQLADEEPEAGGTASSSGAGSTALPGAGDPAPAATGQGGALQSISLMLMGFGFNPSDTDLAEIFSPSRFAGKARLFGFTPGLAADLRTGWNLSTAQGRQECWATLERQKPYLVIGSPMCKAFSTLQNLSPGSEAYWDTYREGVEHLMFCMRIYQWQVAGNRKFLHEHPWAASSWHLRGVQEVLALPGVELRKGFQCGFGQTAVDHQGPGLVAKPTGWLSNCTEVLDEVARDCSNHHEPPERHHRHVQLIGGKAKAAERYPPRLVLAILRGLRRHLQAPTPGQPLRVSALEAGVTVEEPEVVDGLKHWCDQHGKRFFDEITGAELDPEGVRAARRDEMDFMARLKVWDAVDVAICWAETGRPPIGTRWVDGNKGDLTRPDYRSRLVVQETKASGTIAAGDVGATFAATPPLEALRLLLSLTLTGDACEQDPAEQVVLRFLDISRAHPRCPIRRRVFVKLPPEDPDSQDASKCGLLRMALYGTRDAGQNFEFKSAEVLVDAGLTQGLFSPCLYKLPEKRLMVFLHGDDYVISGPRRRSAWLRDHIGKTFIVKDRGVLSPDGPGEHREITILNRILRWLPRGTAGSTDDALEYEADPRHAEILVAQMKLTQSSKAAPTPGVKAKVTESSLEELPSDEAAVYRSACVRLGYLASDRPEVQFAAKECARGMAKPTRAHQEALKRAVRFVHGNRRVVWRYERQPRRSFIDAFSDSDWAGCPVTRRSTSATALRHGRRLISTSSTTQVPISLSSGEAEFYSIAKTASKLLGLIRVAEDYGVEAQGRLWTDAAAAKGMASRRGVGGVRHLETPTLWVQKAAQDGKFSLHKEDGPENIADLGTKHVEAATLWKLLRKMGLYVATGESAVALKAAV